MVTYLLIPLSTEAALIRATVEGTVGSNSGITQFMNGGMGSDFTLLFDFDDSAADFDDSAADFGGGGTSIANFETVQAAQIDGFNLVQSGTNTISYLRQPSRDLTSVDLGDDADGTGITGFFSGLFPLNYWGAGPYTADQFSMILLTDFLFPPNVSFYNHATEASAFGNVTSISFAPASSGSSVPEPSSAILLAFAAGVGAILYRRKRKSLALQSTPNA
ncbi:PEP-CTERM sorting domain-containing protein [Planctomicrobium sp.]|nr:PEP-CTERM sorting domain-containing protein [Planctomicrobium sp.]MDB4732824.1 PEP-CTERM sorting domain-containing protein [Planctomicrobium sp.]